MQLGKIQTRMVGNVIMYLLTRTLLLQSWSQLPPSNQSDQRKPYCEVPTNLGASWRLVSVPLLECLLQLQGNKCASVEEGGAHLQGVEPIWTQPSEFCSSILGLTWPSRVGTATEHRRSLCSHWALTLACPSPSQQHDSCQHTLGRDDLWPAQLQLCPKALCTQTAQTWVHRRTAPQNQDRKLFHLT